MILVLCFLIGLFHCINGIEIDSSTLTTNQTEIWLDAVFQINYFNQTSRIDIIRLGDTIDISLYKNEDQISEENRHLFKQNIHKQIDCYVYKNQINSIGISNIYDPCHGAFSSRKALEKIAGTYVYTGTKTSSSLGLILVEITDSLHWFNNTIESYVFDKSPTIKNGTQLSLGFQCNIYYNSNSDLLGLNNQINDIVQQANVVITMDKENNLETFFLMENLSCQRYQQIVYDDLRLLTIVCMTKVTFQCPLQIGSSCWIENKSLSNIQLNIGSHTFNSTKTITVRIDV